MPDQRLQDFYNEYQLRGDNDPSLDQFFTEATRRGDIVGLSSLPAPQTAPGGTLNLTGFPPSFADPTGMAPSLFGNTTVQGAGAYPVTPAMGMGWNDIKPLPEFSSASKWEPVGRVSAVNVPRQRPVRAKPRPEALSTSDLRTAEQWLLSGGGIPPPPWEQSGRDLQPFDRAEQVRRSLNQPLDPLAVMNLGMSLRASSASPSPASSSSLNPDASAAMFGNVAPAANLPTTLPDYPLPLNPAQAARFNNPSPLFAEGARRQAKLLADLAKNKEMVDFARSEEAGNNQPNFLNFARSGGAIGGYRPDDVSLNRQLFDRNLPGFGAGKGDVLYQFPQNAITGLSSGLGPAIGGTITSGLTAPALLALEETNPWLAGAGYLATGIIGAAGGGYLQNQAEQLAYGQDEYNRLMGQRTDFEEKQPLAAMFLQNAPFMALNHPANLFHNPSLVAREVSDNPLLQNSPFRHVMDESPFLFREAGGLNKSALMNTAGAFGLGAGQEWANQAAQGKSDPLRIGLSGIMMGLTGGEPNEAGEAVHEGLGDISRGAAHGIADIFNAVRFRGGFGDSDLNPGGLSGIGGGFTAPVIGDPRDEAVAGQKTGGTSPGENAWAASPSRDSAYDMTAQNPPAETDGVHSRGGAAGDPALQKLLDAAEKAGTIKTPEERQVFADLWRLRANTWAHETGRSPEEFYHGLQASLDEQAPQNASLQESSSGRTEDESETSTPRRSPVASRADVADVVGPETAKQPSASDSEESGRDNVPPRPVDTAMPSGSPAERSRLSELQRDPRVVSVQRAEGFSLTDPQTGERYDYNPSFVVSYRGGRVEYQEVQPGRVAQTPYQQRKAVVASAYLQDRSGNRNAVYQIVPPGSNPASPVLGATLSGNAHLPPPFGAPSNLAPTGSLPALSPNVSSNAGLFSLGRNLFMAGSPPSIGAIVDPLLGSPLGRNLSGSQAALAPLYAILTGRTPEQSGIPFYPGSAGQGDFAGMTGDNSWGHQHDANYFQGANRLQAGIGSSLAESSSNVNKTRPPANPNSYGASIREKLHAHQAEHDRNLRQANARLDRASKAVNMAGINAGKLSEEQYNRLIETKTQEFNEAQDHFNKVRDSLLPDLHGMLAPADPISQKNQIGITTALTDERVAQMKKAAAFVASIVSQRVAPSSLMIGLDHAVPDQDGSYRPYYEDRVAYLRPNETVRLAIHELGHWLGQNSRAIQDQAFDFYDRRTKGEPLVPLGEGYRPNEFTREDAFLDRYSGKEYIKKGIRYDTEIITTGLERLFEDPIGFAKQDPDYFDFLIAALHGEQLRGN